VLHIQHAAKPGTTSREFENAFQLDLNSKPTAYHVYVDNMKISYLD
jgi:hypothetical protein